MPTGLLGSSKAPVNLVIDHVLHTYSVTELSKQTQCISMIKIGPVLLF